MGMAINYYPDLGEALWCEYTGRVPEMCKRRLAIVVTPREVQRFRLVTVVPVSATPPNEVRPWNVRLTRDPYPQGKAGEVWAQCDMVNVVSFDRLWGYHTRWNGARKYQKMQVGLADLIAVREAVLKGLGLHGWKAPEALAG